MIITRTPYRISFFGGGTDYPKWYKKFGGAVLATTIDKYCYITCRRFPPFFDSLHRIVYSQIEDVKAIQEIQHPAVRAVFEWAGIKEGLEIQHVGDLPARSGLGSSSSFTVGLVNTIRAYQGHMINKEDLAKKAIHIEQNLIKENVGSQDQISAAFGGLNFIEFQKNGSFSVSPVIIHPKRQHQLESHLMLCFTGFSRIASEIAKSKIENLRDREYELKTMRGMVDDALTLLQDESRSILEFGSMLDASWKLKRRLSDLVSTPQIDTIYERALKAGAIGGKILGAGGGGFMLLFAKPETQQAIRDELKELIHVPIKIEDSGSRVVLYQPNGL